MRGNWLIYCVFPKSCEIRDEMIKQQYFIITLNVRVIYFIFKGFITYYFARE